MSAATSPAPGPDPADAPQSVPQSADQTSALPTPAQASDPTSPSATAGAADPVSALPDDLGRLLARTAEIMGAASLAEPPFEHPPGEPAADWRRRVAAARAAHDAHARARRAAVDTASRELFGVDVATVLFGADQGGGEPLGDRASLSRTRTELPAASDASLLRLAPGLARPRARVSDVPAPPRRLGVTITAPPAPRAAIVRLHGGAFWMGGGETPAVVDGAFIDALALGCSAAVIDVDYRLAPEDPFPAAVLDVLHAVDVVRSDALGLGIDPDRVAMVGTSSGANIATVAAMFQAAAGAPPLAGLALVVPSADATSAPSAVRDDPASWRSRQRLVSGYLGGRIDPSSPHVSPGLLSAIEGMPPTFAAVASFDEIAVGGEAMCRAIRAGDGEAEAREYPMTHTTATPAVEARVIRDVVAFLAARL